MKLFSDGSDLRKAKSVADLTYMKILRINLLVLGGWPQDKISSALKNGHGWHMAVINFICYVTQICYIKNNIDTLSSFELGHSYITLFMTTVFTSRIILVFTKKYNKIAANFLESMHLWNHENKSIYAKETHILVHKISHVFTLYLYAMMIGGVTLFNIMPLYTNFSKGMFGSNRPENSTFEHSVYHSVPFDYTTKFRGYLVIYIFNFYVTYFAASSFCTHDLYLSLMVFHVWGHIKILINYLDEFPRPAGAGKAVGPDGNQIADGVKYSDEELKNIYARLREGINHHNFILGFASNMSNTFGEILFFYYTFHQVCGCFLLLELSQMDIKVLLRYGMMTFVLFQQLIQISVIFELLGTSGEKLAIAIYALPWECMDTKNRKLVLFMLCRSQISMNVKALDMVSIGVQTMIGIFKTSFSYFIMLQTLASTEE